jgi:hypothetical protein
MLYAVAYPDPEQGKRTDLFPDETSRPGKVMLSKARAVLSEAPRLFPG